MMLRGSSAKPSLLGALLGVLLVLAGCDNARQGVFASKVEPVPAAAPKDFSKLDKNDRLKVTVFNEPQLSGEFVIDDTGTIPLPLVGQIPLAGLTIREAEQRITQKLSGRYLVNPRVGIELMSQRPFYIMGEVGKAGEYPFRPGLNVVSAVAMAGGYTGRASDSYVLIRRAGENEEKRYPALPNVPVYPGDLIKVPERWF